VLNVGHFAKQIRNKREALKCGDGERWRRSIGPIVWKMKKYYEQYKESRGQGYPTYHKQKEG
jgi:hypothetical protein